MKVTLTGQEIMQGAFVGIMRQTQNLRDSRIQAHNVGKGLDWQMHVEGALGEFALAKLLGTFWSGAHSFRGVDVGKWQVRTTPHDNGSLILHDSDADEDRFVLMTGGNGEYVVRGWILAAAGKRKHWWRDPTGKGRPAFFVPQSALEAWRG